MDKQDVIDRLMDQLAKARTREYFDELCKRIEKVRDLKLTSN
jgi:hypothetical protein